MIPLIPALILSLISFIASAFIILRIIVPILPPHPLSKRVSPAEFGLPTFRSLSPADKSHLWLASLDLVALSLFIWQIVTESTAGPSGIALATDPGSAIRLWILVTIRQTCLLFVVAITLLHIRMARSVSFGGRHWMLWAPTALLVFTSTTIAGILSGTGINTLFAGMTAYTITIAVVSSITFACLVRTLFAIKKNLAIINDTADAWPPVREVEERPRPSFGTEDIDAIRDGSSWVTSEAGSHRHSASAWSFSTHYTAANSQYSGRVQTANHPSVPAKSTYWFNGASSGDIQVPPVPPLPSPYGPLSPTMADSDPFRKDPPAPKQQKMRMGSQTSWLTSSAGSHATATSWSYPTTYSHRNTANDSQYDIAIEGPTLALANAHYESSIQGETVRNPSPQDYNTAGSRPLTPAMADAQVLGGYGYAPGGMEEKGLPSFTSVTGNSTIEISMLPAFGWSVIIWLPLSFALPYFITLSQDTTPSTIVQVLFTLSVTLSSPLLALNLLCGSPLPIPVGLFDSNSSLPVDPRPMIHGSFPPHQFSHEYKRSTSCSVTVVEARRSGDVWLSKGNAVDGKSKLSRAVGMLQARPKLSVLPPEDNDEVLDEPPVPFDDESSGAFHVNGTPRSEMNAQFGRLRKESRTGSHNSGASENLAYTTKIMIAQRHYSAMAQTVVVPGPGSPVTASARDSVGAATLVGAATGVASKRNSHTSHLRSRSTSSIGLGPTQAAQEHHNPSPPPSFPLPPTPPSVRNARRALLAHKKSFSSGFSLGADLDSEMNEIDALTAGVLPLLVPGLKVGDDMKIKKGNYTPPGSFSKAKGKKVVKRLAEFGEDFSSPQVHSTPARRRQPRGRKESGHKKNHFSLPSLSLGREGMHSLAVWGSDIRSALETKVGQYTAIPTNVDLGHARRNTVVGVESASSAVSHLGSVQEEEDANPPRALGRTMSTRSLGLRADVPHDVDTARSSVASVNNMPPSAASTVTLFDDFEAGLLSSPQAESTPHSSVAQRPVSRHAPPPVPNYRRSSGIYYIKSPTEDQPAPYRVDEEDEAQHPEVQPSAIASIAQWSSRAVRLIPKASKLQRSPPDATSPKEGLRTLTLLQDRGNTINSSPPAAETRPLAIGKAQRVRRAAPQDENALPPLVRTSSASSRSKNLKSLTLVRSETSKVRGILRKTEVLPEVVVRPPSTTEHTAFAYNFRD